VIERRAFVIGSAAVLAAPLVTMGQQAGRVFLVGWLDLGTSSSNDPPANFKHAMRELGWIPGTNIAFDSVYAGGRVERLPAMVAELLRRKVDVIVTTGTTAIRAAKEATSTVPIVMVGGGDPVGTGLVQSLARPGGNVTGVSLVGKELMEKNVDLLRQLVPGINTVTLIRAAANPGNRFFSEHMAAAAERLGIRVNVVDIRDAGHFEEVFSEITGDAAFMLLDPMFDAHVGQIAELAIRRRLPLMSALRWYAEHGFLLTHGTSRAEVIRLAARFVDKILRGAKPGDLPVEQPTKFELVINLKTAKALGLTIPPSLLLRADQVIE